MFGRAKSKGGGRHDQPAEKKTRHANASNAHSTAHNKRKRVDYSPSEASEESDVDLAAKSSYRAKSRLNKRQKYVDDDSCSESSEESVISGSRPRSDPKSRHTMRSKRHDVEYEDSVVGRTARSHSREKFRSSKRSKRRESNDSETDTRYRSREKSGEKPRSTKDIRPHKSDNSQSDWKIQVHHLAGQIMRIVDDDSQSNTRPRLRDESRSTAKPTQKEKGKQNETSVREESEGEANEGQIPGWMTELINAENKRMANSISSAKTYMGEHFPAVTQARFSDLTRGRFTEKDWDEATAQWKADPIRPSILGQNLMQGKNRAIEAFLSPYRMLLRYYNCLYEDFMGPKYRLKYDQNDTFPKRQFSAALTTVLSQPIWFRKIRRVALSLQFVNILRTNDTRPWNLLDWDRENEFFRTWKRVVAADTEAKAQTPIRDLFTQVKAEVEGDELYCLLFDSIINIVGQQYLSSRRTSDEDPYFIGTEDINMLIGAIDKIQNFGLPIFPKATLTEAAVKHSRPNRDYPQPTRFEEARDREIIYTRMMNELEDHDLSGGLGGPASNSDGNSGGDSDDDPSGDSGGNSGGNSDTSDLAGKLARPGRRHERRHKRRHERRYERRHGRRHDW